MNNGRCHRNGGANGKASPKTATELEFEGRTAKQALQGRLRPACLAGPQPDTRSALGALLHV